ncbi:MAG: DUF819 family protein, partial [Cyclobacteriaceae bacterium]
MNFIWLAFQATFIIIFPYLAYRLASWYQVFRYISPVVLCYLGGIVLANIPFFNLNKSVSVNLSEISIPLAITLVVFSLDIKKWLRHAGKAAFSFLLCVISAIISALLAVLIFTDFQTETWKLAGMSVGVYTGGTPNMSAIGMALEVNDEVFVLMNASDVVLGGLYLIFLMTIAHPLLSKILPAYKNGQQKTEIDQDIEQFNQQDLLQKIKFISIGISLSIVCLSIAVGLSMLLLGKMSVVSIIITITTLAVAGSFIGPVRKVPGTYEAGEYLLLIFCVAIGSLVNIEQLINTTGEVFYFLAFVMTSAILIHYLLAYLFKVDVDTLLI